MAIYFIVLVNIRPRHLKSVVCCLFVAAFISTAWGYFVMLKGPVFLHRFSNSYWGELIYGYRQYRFEHIYDILRWQNYGTFGDPNYFAAFLSVPLCMAFGLYLADTGKYIYGFCSIFFLLSTVMTFSRSGYLALLFSFSLMFLLRGRKERTLIPFIVLGLAVIVLWKHFLTLADIFTGLNKLTIASLQKAVLIRTDTWRTFLQEVFKHPVLGTNLPPKISGHGHSHNWYIDTVGRIGLIGMGIWVFIIGRVLGQCREYYHRLKDKFLRGFVLGTGGAVLWFLVQSFFSLHFVHRKNAMSFWLLLPLSMIPVHTAPVTGKRTLPDPFLRFIFTLIYVLFFLVLIWELFYMGMLRMYYTAAAFGMVGMVLMGYLPNDSNDNSEEKLNIGECSSR